MSLSKERKRDVMATEAERGENRVWKHVFAGAWAPPGVNEAPGQQDAGWGCPQEMFSVGIFQWVPRASGTGVKRGPVKVRVEGRVVDARLVAAKARAICELLDIGAYTGPKNVKVR